MKSVLNCVLLIILTHLLQLTVNFSLDENHCPVACSCDFSKDVVKKMKCSYNQWSEVNLRNSSEFFVPRLLQVLDLSRNKITAVTNFFISAPTLKRLFLNENKIIIIDAFAFSNLTNLQTLDLSSNSLYSLNKEIFHPLRLLERLKLRNNKLNNLEPNTFTPLSKLKVIDLTENPWRCDCDLLWLSEWVQTSSVVLQPVAKCEGPDPHVDVSLKRLNLQCEEVVRLELDPPHDQVVFAGDSLDLRCRSVGGASRVRWAWPTADFSSGEVVEEERTLPEHGLVESSLQIKRLSPNHSGSWVCQQDAPGNSSATISVLVISPETLYCSHAVSKDNKGVYFWPRTVVGNLVELPCAGEGIGVGKTAERVCSTGGHWERSDTSRCPFISETTKILQQFSLDNLSLPGDSTLEKAKRLWNLTYSPESLTDPIDVVFLSRAVNTYARHVGGSRELAVVLVDIVATLQRLPKATLRAAQIKDQACTRLLDALEQIVRQLPALQVHTSTLVLEEFTVSTGSFLGMACMWARDSRQFSCGTSFQAVLAGRQVEAAIELPPSLFSGVDASSRHLVVTMFANGHLFPDVSDQIASAVVGVNIVGAGAINISEPVMVMVRSTPGSFSAPMRWHGNGWLQDGCYLSHVNRDVQVFNCNYLGYYSILQNAVVPKKGLQWSFSEVALYSGSLVVLFCLSVSIVSYLICRSCIQMPRRSKHTLINTWLSIGLLCFLFTFGVTETEEAQLCQVVGLSLHYFTLCSLLWMAIAANHMYKTQSRPTDRPPEELPPEAPAQKPILGLYLVGWGIGLIVCGISGAVHLKDYAQATFCFLGSGPALSAILVPSVVLVLLLLALHALSLCATRSKLSDVNGQLSEGTQGTEHVDLELLEEGGGEHRSARSVPSDSDEAEDPEHTPLVLLKAQVIVLAFFLFMWLSAATAITAGSQPVISWQEPVAAGLYCTFAFLLGVFILYFYCVARSDVRGGWSNCRRFLARKRRCCRTRSVSDTQASLPLQTAPPPQIVNHGTPSVQSSSSHRTRAVSDLNNCERKPAASVNLVAMHRQVYRSNNSMPTYHEISGQDFADAFYNPRQSIVAKKFFKKQRRNKRNELGLRRRGDGGTSEGEAPQVCRTWRPSAESAVFLSSDMESERLTPLFGYGSKINNTNIHVGEASRKTQSPKDPNVLSEEDAEKGDSKVLLSRLVIGAEGDAPVLGRVDEEPTAPDCRSVELQCSLGDTDDSFTTKLDGLQLQSDQSCTDSPSSPPHYVTVVDPKYGVVKMTTGDFQDQRVSLSSPSSLPPTPEEGEEEDKPESPVVQSRPVRPSFLSVIPRRREVYHRRSLPSSPEGTETRISQRRSLPPSPVTNLSESSVSIELPPPVVSADDCCSGGRRSPEVDEWQRPSPPTSPDRNEETRRRRPGIHRETPRLSLTPSPEKSSDDAKKETSV